VADPDRHQKTPAAMRAFSFTRDMRIAHQETNMDEQGRTGTVVASQKSKVNSDIDRRDDRFESSRHASIIFQVATVMY
jgi:hypothetical protein